MSIGDQPAACFFVVVNLKILNVEVSFFLLLEMLGECVKREKEEKIKMGKLEN
jgi:hypothetical protein